MNISDQCLDIIKEFEGLELSAYIDPVGIPTIGYGTIRYPNGRKVAMGDRVSLEEAEGFLRHEAGEFGRDIDEIARSDGFTLNQNQFDALVSFCYNVGLGAFMESTLRKELVAKDFAGAAQQFDRWVKGTVNGQKVTLPGLVRRRAKERALFEKAAGPAQPQQDETSNVERARSLKAYRKSGKTYIVAFDDNQEAIERLELADALPDTFRAALATWPRVARFELAPASEALPDVENILFSGLERPNTKPPAGKIPKLDRKLIVLGAEDTEENKSRDVRNMQERLIELGYLNIDPDGVFDVRTDVAVRQFQADHFGWAEADGKVGPLTWGKLWGKGKAGSTGPGSDRPGRHYLLLKKTSEKDSQGCVVLDLAYYRDGKFTDAIEVCSGIPSKQNFRKGKDSIAKSMEPLPEGLWSLQNIEWADGKDNYTGKVWDNGLGPVKIRMDYVRPDFTRRSAIEIHIDWNRPNAWGTAGCIGVKDATDFKRLVGWLRETDPRELFVDYGLGTCPAP